jgi:alpha-glucosidase
MGQLAEFFGEIQSITEFEHGLEFCSGPFHGSIQFFQSKVVRVRFCRGLLTKNHSYAVVAQPETSKVERMELPGRVLLQSSDLKVSLDPKSGMISFLTSQDRAICNDAMPVSWIGTEVTAYKELQAGEAFLGLGEKTGPVNRRGHAFVNWNTDKFAYQIDQDPLYLSTPFYLGVHNGLLYGIFLDNTHKSTFNFGASSERFSWFSADMGELDYYFIHGESIASILESYTWLTGRMKLPPRWALGFQQCRYSYYPDHEVLLLAETFRKKQIPCDVIYLDIHYMDAYKAFTFDLSRFPAPKEMIAKLKDQGFKTAVILDPGIKDETGYLPHETGKAEDVFVKHPDGLPYVGEVWPGRCHFPDFTAPHTREWWGDLTQYYTDLGVMGYWNDMNEPAAWGQCLPNHLVFQFDGNPTTHREARNVYGMQMARSTFEGVCRHLESKRPFVLTRAGFSGIQRFAAVWTGDNVSSDEHMMLGVRLVNSLALTGISFSGNDVGGFVGEASPALYARWVSVAAFQPFFRAHSMANSRDAEPWSFGEEVEQIARNYIGLRYQLMPLIYSLFRKSSQSGLPVVAPLAYFWPHHPESYHHDYHHQFLLGEHLMICPVESGKEHANVWLPEGDWFDFWTGKKLTGGQNHVCQCPIWKLPVFVKAGALIPCQPVQQNLDSPMTSLNLHFYDGTKGTTMFYEDDGKTFAFEGGQFSEREFTWDGRKLHLSASSGTYPTSIQNLRLYFHGRSPLQISINGSHLPTQTETHRFLQPIRGIDTFFTEKGSDLQEDNLAWVEIPYTNQEMSITW